MQLGSFIPLLIGPADAPLAPWSPWIPRSSLRPRPRSVICTPNSVILFGLPLYSILQPTIPLAGSARAHLSTFAQELRSDLHLRTVSLHLPYTRYSSQLFPSRAPPAPTFPLLHRSSAPICTFARSAHISVIFFGFPYTRYSSQPFPFIGSSVL